MRALAAALGVALALAGCGSSEAEPTAALASITNVDTGPGLPGLQGSNDLHGTVDPVVARPTQLLKDTAGKPFSLSDRPANELTIVFWGFTNCPDICPTAMADLARAREALPAAAQDRVRVVFITEDPTRDTPSFLRTWLDRFDPSFTGLIGGNAATAQMLTQLHLPQTTGEPEPAGRGEHGGHSDADYAVDHTGVIYAFVPGGGAVVYTGGTTIDEYTADFTRLLSPA